MHFKSNGAELLTNCTIGHTLCHQYDHRLNDYFGLISWGMPQNTHPNILIWGKGVNACITHDLCPMSLRTDFQSPCRCSFS